MDKAIGIREVERHKRNLEYKGTLDFFFFFLVACHGDGFSPGEIAEQDASGNYLHPSLFVLGKSDHVYFSSILKRGAFLRYWVQAASLGIRNLRSSEIK